MLVLFELLHRPIALVLALLEQSSQRSAAAFELSGLLLSADHSNSKIKFTACRSLNLPKSKPETSVGNTYSTGVTNAQPEQAGATLCKNDIERCKIGMICKVL